MIKYFCHKDNRYSRGRLLIGSDGVMTFISEKTKKIENPIGKSGLATQIVYTDKIVDESFYEHFKEISQLELSVIEFEEDRIKNEFLYARWLENGIIKKELK